MRYKKYKFNATGLYKNIIQVDSQFLIVKTTSIPSRFLVVSDSSFLKQFDYEEGEIILKETNYLLSPQVIILIFISLLILFILWQLQKRRTLAYKRKNKTENSLSIETDEFNQTELELLQLLFTHQESGLEISFINDLVNHDQPSIDTLKKRREILLKDLRYKLSSKFNISQEDVFIERRMETDKRMKLLFLNELVQIKM